MIDGGSHHVTPAAAYDLEATTYNSKLLIPKLEIPGQTDNLIFGSNVLKGLICLMKGSDGYRNLLAKPVDVADSECYLFLSLLDNSDRWEDGPMPDKVGRVERECYVRASVALNTFFGANYLLPLPYQWGAQLIVAATQSRARPRNVLVGCGIIPLWGNRCVPLKLISPAQRL